MNDYQFEATEEGSGQGSVCSPVISCIYMHYRYVLVWWFKEVITPRLKGYGGLIAYADDFVVCFQYKSDAEWFYERLKHRMGYFGLSLEEEKSKNICQCIRLINVNDSFRKEPDAGKPQVRILRGAYDRKGCVYSTPYDFLKFPDKV